MTEVFVIGAGASGMTAAIEASKEALNLKKSFRITILEHNTVPGRKLLATGNGRCNLTNRELNTGCFRSHDMKRLELLLQKDDNANPEKIIEYFRKLGMICTDKNGYIYPHSCQAATVNDILYDACKRLGVNMVFDAHVLDIIPRSEGGYIIKTSEGITDAEGNRKKKRNEYVADRVIIACGSKAYPKLGADGSGYKLAENTGHKLIDVVPALTGLKCREKLYSLAAGVRTNAEVCLYVDHELVARDKGELQLTEYGISGIPVFQVSRYAAYGLADGCKVHAVIDFMPDYDRREILKLISYNISIKNEADIYTVLCGMINSRLAHMVLAYCRIDENLVNCSTEQLGDIADALKSYYTVITGTNDFEQAQVCAGGVRLSEVDDSFQSVRLPGLYITGEMLDVDGACGGYNLHWAWITGMAAGRNAVKGNNQDDSYKSDKSAISETGTGM